MSLRPSPITEPAAREFVAWLHVTTEIDEACFEAWRVRNRQRLVERFYQSPESRRFQRDVEHNVLRAENRCNIWMRKLFVGTKGGAL